MDREGGSNGGSCYYSVLGIRREASFSDIRTAYRKLALVFLPRRLPRSSLTLPFLCPTNTFFYFKPRVSHFCISIFHIWNLDFLIFGFLQANI